ncbi:MAG: VacJ family lipoprotein [Alphaproteobacteria bacterium]|nr:VacJ family lipoprotein [Alphaproteobacteria bacterium]
MTRLFRPTVIPLLALLVLPALPGCATAPDLRDAEARAEYERINDPIEPFNRAIFALNRAIDKALIRPLATLYRDLVPQAVRDAIGNVLANLGTPVVLANDVLQGEPERAKRTLARFVVNSTVGMGGIADVAAEMGVPRHTEDFGQTLAVWGVGEGPYLVLPLIGPSNPRDAVGLVADFFTSPLNWYAVNTGQDWITFAHTGTTALDSRTRHMKALDEVEQTSLDYYAAIRSLYRQRRQDEIRNGQGGSRMPAPGLTELKRHLPGGMMTELSAAEPPPYPLTEQNAATGLTP